MPKPPTGRFGRYLARRWLCLEVGDRTLSSVGTKTATHTDEEERDRADEFEKQHVKCPKQRTAARDN